MICLLSLEPLKFTQKQLDIFTRMSNEICTGLAISPLKHIANSSAIERFPQAHFDMIRLGIGLHGISAKNADLQQVSTLKTVISQIKTLDIGETVGYNRGFKSETFQKTATIPIGHADGIGRQYGNGKGFVIINGEKAPIIGNVCMDMIMVNITNINCKEGDEVIIFDNVNTAENLAKTANTISYELITSVSQRIKRTFCR